jgi:hypothetical protein
MTEGVFALLGVVLGALLNWFVALSARRSARSERRRQERLDVVVRFLADADAVWLAKQRLAEQLVQLPASLSVEQDPVPEELRTSLRGAKLGIGRLRLLWPEIVEPASALLSASELYTWGNYREQRAAREDAMRRLEAIAHKVANT